MTKEPDSMIGTKTRIEITSGRILAMRSLLSLLVDHTKDIQTDPICISLTQGIQAHLNELETRLRLLSEPDSVTKEEHQDESTS